MKKNIKIALILIGILIVGIIVYKENKEIYSIEDRVKNIQKETQKDSQLFTSLQYRGKELVENMQLFVYNMNFEE